MNSKPKETWEDKCPHCEKDGIKLFQPPLTAADYWGQDGPSEKLMGDGHLGRHAAFCPACKHLFWVCKGR
jgi:hypothetical protein